jgi:tRNA threonylcarbamoyladenosine biosynthesis protein TsaE
MTVTSAAPVRVTSSGPDDTRAAATRLGPLLVSGDLILLGGDLGAGKTTFTQGVARGLGIDEPVTSPTFTLLRSYPGRKGLRLLHADVYRLDHLQEIVDIGLPELLDEGAVAVVEWGDVVAPVLLPEYLHVRIAFGEGDDERILIMQPVGPRWCARLRSLHEAFDSPRSPP